MKIAAVGNESSRNAMTAKKFAPGVEWAWVDTVGALGQHRDAVLYADFNFTPDKARIGQLGQFLPRPVLVHSVIHSLAEIGQPFIRINGWPGLLERVPCELAVGRQFAATEGDETGIEERGPEKTGMEPTASKDVVQQPGLALPDRSRYSGYDQRPHPGDDHQ